MEETHGLLIWTFILAFLCHVVFTQVCELDPCPAGERCFVRTVAGEQPYVCECTPPGGIGFDCSNNNIPYDELFTCYGRECTSSTFTTPNFPSPYTTNYRALFLIFVPGGEEITFQLGFPYDIGPGDFLYVGRGLEFTEADLLRPSISGEFYIFGTNDGTFLPFTLLGDAFWMYFVSDEDNSAQAQGFGMLWTARMITDQGPEILGCPQDISLELETTSPQIPVTWVEPTSSDPTATSTSNRTPGQAFNVPSTTTVTYTFTNDQGVSTCSFVIAITAATGDRPPVITNCPGAITEFADEAFSGALIDWMAPDVTDDSPGMLEITQTHIPPEFFAIGEHMVTYTYTDSAGNSNSCSFMVTVIDVTAPSINNCPSDISITATSPNGAIAEWQRPTATDNSAQVTVTGNFESGDLFNVGVTTVRYTAVDSSGNSVICSFTVTVTSANTGVTISNCPADMTVVAENGQAFMFVTWTPPTGQDANGQNIVPTSTFQPGSFFGVGTETIVRYTFLGSGGQSEVCSFTIRVVAGVDMGLRVEDCSDDILEIAPIGFNFVTVMWTEPTAVDQFAVRYEVPGSLMPGSYFEVGTTTRVTYNFVDNAGNTAVCSFLVTVQFTGDQLDVLGCPTIPIRETIPIGSSTVPVFWTPPTVSQNAVVGAVDILSNFQPGDLFPPGETTVTYSFTDSVGSTGLCSFTVIVTQDQDVTPPTVICPNDIFRSIPAGQACLTVTWEIPFTSDNSGAGVTTTSSPSSGSCLTGGTTTVTVTAADSSGNLATCQFSVVLQTTDPCTPNPCLNGGTCIASPTTNPPFTCLCVTGFSQSDCSADTEPPTVVCPNDVVRSIPLADVCTQITWEIPFVNDNSGGVVNAVSAPVSGTCFMVNSVTNVVVTAMDPSGNTDSCQFTVTVNELAVVDNNPPFVLCPNDITRNIPVEQGCSEVTWQIPFVQDDSGEVTTMAIPPSGTCFNPGMTNVMVTATDPSGNTDVCSFMVNIIALDFEPPTLTCPDNIVREIPATDNCVNVNWEVPFVNDNSGGTIEVLSTPASGTCFFVGTSTNILVTAEDPQGNLASCQFVVTVNEMVVIDTTPPTVTCPDDITQDRPVEQPCVQVVWEVPFFVDDSGGPVSIASTPNSGSCISNAVTTVTVTATDPSGNENTCNFIITIRTVDTEPPTVICPNDISRNIPILQPCLEVSWTIPFVTDNSGDMVDVESTPPSGSCLPAGTTMVMVSATDPSGNANFCSFAVNLVEIDTEPPSIQCPEDISQTILTGQQCTEVTWQIPSVSDNSGQDVSVTSVPPSGTCFSDMASVVTVTASDPSNNMNTCTFVVRIDLIDPCSPNPCLNGGTCVASATSTPPFICLCVTGFSQIDCSEDTEPPSLQCPDNISQTILSGQECTEVTWQIPSVSDNSGQDVTLLSVPPSGTCFSDAETLVTVTALDSSNNVNTCSFVVIINQVDPCTPNPCLNGGTCVPSPASTPTFTCLCVAGFTQMDCSMDTLPPSVACPQDIVVPLATGEACAVATWTMPQATDNSADDLIIVSSPPSGTCFQPGTTTVQVTASDQSGNLDQCTFDVTVIQDDTTPPIVVCPQNMERGTANGCVIVEWMIPFASDAGSGEVSTTSAPPSGTCFDVGVTDVVVTATDAAGNSATCSFSVAVTANADNIPPIVICPQNLRETLQEGSCVVVEWVVPFTSDNQGGPVTEMSVPPSGTCFDVGRTDVTVTATDTAGNSAACNFFVEISQLVDTTPPTIQNCPTSDVEVTLPPGETCTTIIWMEPTAVDEDGQPPMVLRFPSDLDCFSPGEILFSYVFTDQARNTALCTFSVVITAGQVVDNTPPTVLTCPPNANGIITTAGGCAEVTWTPPIATDDSVGVLQGEPNIPLGTCFEQGSTTVTYTFTDPSGNIAVCTFEVVVMLIDGTPPVVTQCPADISLEALSNDCTPVTWIVPQAVDNTGLPVTVETQFTPGQCFQLGTTTVLYTFRDPSGNAAICSFVVTITNPSPVDTEPPLVLNCPDDITDQAGPDDTCTRVFWNEPFGLDAVSGLATTIQTSSPGNCFSVGVTPVTYTFTDAAGNSATCQFNVNINLRDFIPPVVINCPDDITVQGQAGTSCTPVSWTVPTVIDNLPGEIVTTASSSPGDCFSPGPTAVVYQYTDVAGNMAMCMFTIFILLDDTPPIITNCPTDISEQAAPGATCAVIFWSEPMAIDTVSGIPSLDRNFVPGTCFNIGTTPVVYTFRDASGNEAVCLFLIQINQVIDFTPPVIRDCPTDITIPGQPGSTCQPAFWITPTATDDVPGDITVTSSAIPGDCFPFAPTMVTYTFTDAAGNSATCAFIVQVFLTDTTPPLVFGCPSDISLQAPAFATCQTITWVEPIAVDDSGGPVFTQSTQSPGDCLPLGMSVVSYTFTDVTGNNAFCQFTVSITPVDNNPPVISNCPADITIQSAASSGCEIVTWIEPTATDETSIPILQEKSHDPGQCFAAGPTLVTYRFADLEGNIAMCSFIVTVNLRDVDPPVVVGCPDDMTLQALAGDPCVVAQWMEPLAFDSGNGQVIVMQTSQPGSCLPIGNTLVSYIFTDGSGNVAACTFTITVFVLDVIPPTVTNCPNDIVTDAISNDQCTPVNWVEPAGIDDRPGPVTIRQQTHFPGACFSIGQTLVTYVLQDAAGNTASCSFTVTINARDETPPEVVFCPSDISLDLETNSQCLIANWPDPLFTDNSPIEEVVVTQTAFSGECFPVGRQTVLYTFTDAAGNGAICVFNVEVIRRDILPPVVTNCPTDITLRMTPNLQCLSVTWIEPTATDESLPITTTVTHPIGTCFGEGTTFVMYSFRDAVGNTAFCSFTVEILILDNTPPAIISCPSDIVQSISFPATCATVSFPVPTAVDDSGDMVNVLPSHSPGDCFNVGITSVSYNFIDSSGNLASCMFNIQVNVNDVQSPVISSCPSNIMLTLPVGQMCVTTTWITPIATDESGQVTTTVNVDQNTCFPLGQNAVIYTFRDDSGNSATCSFQVIVNPAADIIPPVVVSCPDSFSIVVPLGQPCATVDFNEPVAFDNSGMVVISSQTLEPNACLQPGVTQVVYTFQDSSQNEATCEFTITVSPAADITPPVVIGCPDSFSIVVPLGQPCATVDFNEPVAFDDSGIAFILSQTLEPNACLQPGVTQVVYTFQDSSQNEATCEFTITVSSTADTTPPVVIGCPDSFSAMVPLGQPCATVDFNEPVAFDDSGMVVISSQTLEPNACLQPGVTQVVYTFQDSSQNEATCEFTITVSSTDPCTPNPCFNGGTCVPTASNNIPFTCLCTAGFTQSDCSLDTQPPTFTCPQDITVNLANGETCSVVTWETPQATDNSGNNVVVVSSPQSGTCFEPGTTPVQVTATDQSGNSDQCTFFVNVLQAANTPPSIPVCPMVLPVTSFPENLGNVVTWTIGDCNDAENGAVTPVCSPMSNTLFNVGTTPVTCTCTDSGGLSTECTFNAVVQAVNTPPSPLVCPSVAPVTSLVGNMGNSVVWTIGACTDAEDGAITPVCDPMSNSFFNVGTTPVTCTCTDTGGLSTECTFSVVVGAANTPPTNLICPTVPPVTSFAGDIGNVIMWTIGDCTDAEDGAITPVCNPMSNTFFNVGTTPVICTCTDSAGLSAECTFSAIVNPVVNTPPSTPVCPMVAPVTSVVGNLGNSVMWTIGDCTDAEDGAITPVCDPVSNSFFNVGANPVTCTCTDSGGLTTDCTFNVVVGTANNPPSNFVCPTVPAVTSFAGNVGNLVMWTIGDCMDVEDGAITPVCNPMSNTFFNVGTTPVTCTCTDSAGLLAECTFNAVVETVNTPPSTPDCPTIAPVTSLVGNLGNSAMWTIGDCTDAEDGSITPMCNPMSGSFFSFGTTSVTCTCTDSSGLFTDCTFNVVIGAANTPPTNLVCPTVPPVTSFPGDIGNLVMWTIGDCTDAEDGAITPVCNPMSNTFFNVGTTPVTCTCTDSAGLSAECTFNTVVNPANNPPSNLVCPTVPPVTSFLGNVGNLVMWTIGDCMDVEDGAITPVCNPMSNTFFNVGTTPVTCTCTDSAGLSAECTFNAVVNPVNNPPSTPVCPTVAPVNSLVGNLGNSLMWTIGDCTDAEDGSITPVCNPMSNSFFNVGTTPVTCTCTDSGGLSTECTFNAVINPVNNPPSIPACPVVAPVTSFAGNVGNVITWIIADCTDAEDGAITPVCNPFSNNFFSVGTTSVTCTCTDSAGLSTQCTFNAVVNPVNTPPTNLACPTVQPVTSLFNNVGNLVTWTIGDCMDAEDGAITPVCNPMSNTFLPVGTTSVTCTCTDSGGLSAECMFNAVVNPELDTTPPQLSACPPDQTGIAVTGSCQVINWTPPTATDNSGQVVVSSDIMPGFCFPIGETTVTYTATDSSNNIAQCTFQVIINQDQPPEVMGCPSDIAAIVPIGSTCVLVSWTVPTATDDTGTVTTTLPTLMPNTCLTVNTYEIIYVFTDLANQQSTCMFQITVTPEEVIDTTPPVVLNCPMEDIVRFAQTGMSVSVTWVEPTAMDNSGQAVIITQNASPGDNFNIGDFRVTYTFTDQAGNLAAPCQFLISVIEDNEPPTVMGCPLDFFITVSLTEGGQVITWNEPTAVDNSGRPVTEVMTGRMSGTFFEVGTNENIVYTFTDEAGNVATCMFNIIVTVSTEPLNIQNCPMDLTLSAEPGQVSTAVVWTVPTATGVMPITVVEPPQQPGDQIQFGSTEIVYQFTDGNGLMADCRFIVTVLVTPVILNCPMSFVQDAPPGSTGALVSWTEPTPMGVEPFMTVFPDTRPNSFLPPGDTVITYSFTDAIGQEVTCQFTVTVNVLDSPPIVISDCPMSFTVDAQPGQPTAVATWTIPTATGFDPVTPTSIPPFNPGGTPFPVGMDVTLTYTFTDGLGMTADCTFTITPRDVTPPSFITDCPPSPVLEFIGPMDENTVVTWTVPMAVDDIPGGTVTTVVTPDSNIFTAGNTPVTYTFSDAAGNSIMCSFVVSVVVDNLPPVIIFCPMNITVNADPTLNGQVVTWNIPTATDNVGLNPDVVVTGGTPNTVFPVGVNTITYTFSDIFGNTADCIFYVEVVGDTSLPVISGCPLEPISAYTAVGVPSTVNWVPPTATDTDGGAITTTSTHTPNESVFQPGSSTPVTYTFTDVFGNAATCTFQVILLEDSTPPMAVNCPGDILINLESGMTQSVAQWLAPTGTDNSGLPVTVVRDGPASGSLFRIGDTVITYTITDSVGLTSLCSFTVSIRDITPPQILNCPTEDLVRYSMTPVLFVELPELLVTDDTGVVPTLITSDVPAQNMFQVGSTLVTFSYSDLNGNFATCAYNVNVILDNTAPTVVCPDTVQVFVPLGVTTTPVTYPNPTVTDDSGLTPTLVTTTGIESGGLFPVGQTSLVSFQYADAAGNQAGCILQVVVNVDNTPPTITSCTPTAMAFASSTNPLAVVNFAEPTATDNSGLEVTLTVTGLRSGSLFPAGTSTTVYTFTDSVGNAATCETVVTVQIDNTPPAIMDCPTDIVATVPNTETQLQVNFATPTATDNSGEIPRLSSITGVLANNIYPVGTTLITYTFEDNFGNSAVCQFSIIISQEVCNPSPCAANEVCTSDGGNPPMAVCTATATPCQSNPCNPATEFCVEVGQTFICVSSDTTSPVVSGCPTTTVTQTVPTTTTLPVLVSTPVPTATDNSNVAPTVTVTGLPAGNLFPEGTTVVTYTFTDGNNNQATCTFSVIVDVDYCSPNPCPVGNACTEGSPTPSQVVCATACASNPCNPFFEICLELPNGAFICSPNGNMPTIPVVNNCPTSDITQTVDFIVTPPVFVDTPVPTTTTAGATVDVTGLPTGNLFPEGSTLITYTFTSPDGGQAMCSFNVIVDINYCSPNPCTIGLVCTEGAAVPSQVVCTAAAQCTPTTCPTVGEFCFLQANVPTCVNIGTNPQLTDCPTTAYMVYTMTGTATFDVPIPSLTNFPAVAVTVTMNPSGNTFVAGTNTPVTFTFTDDPGAAITLCTVGVTTITDVTPPVVTACPDAQNTVTVNSGTAGVIVIPNPQPAATDDSNQVSTAITGQPANDFYPVGVTTVTYTFSDPAGNTATCTFSVTVLVDVCTPTSCLANQVCVPDTSPQGFSCVDQCVDATTCPGQYCFNSFALTAGSPCVNSLTDPALESCPPETVTALTPFGATTTTVVLPMPFLRDFPTYPVTVNQVPPGDSFSIGTTPVFQFIVDDVGNPISLCQRTVTVSAATAPGLMLSNCDPSTTITRLVAGGTTEAQVFFDEPSAVGGQGTVTLSLGQFRSGSMFPVGSVTPAIFTFTDETPTTLQCTRFISVVADAEAPTISGCVSPVTMTVDSTTTSAVVTVTAPTAVDNNNLPVTTTLSGFPDNNVYPVGTTVVSYVFTDSVGNVARCDILVVVDQNLCNPNPCNAGETCAEDNSMQGFSCTGTAASPCASNPCPAGQICLEVGNIFVCTPTGRRRRGIFSRDEDTRQRRSVFSSDEMSLDNGSSPNVVLSYMFIVTISIAAMLSTAFITAWYHWKKHGRGQRSAEAAVSNI